MGTNASQPAFGSNEQSQLQVGEQKGSKDPETVDSPSSSSSSTSSSWSVASDRTLIIFDWDDTLLCSSALDYTPGNAPILRQLEITVEAILRTAMRFGETMIVTNGCATWVQESSKAYLPGLVPTLESLAVFSARAMYEQAHPADPLSWKRRCFRKILKQKRASGHCGLNIVVLGDQAAEMHAVHSAVKVFQGPSLVKTVKFVESPSVEQLLGQLRKVAQELGGLVCAEKNSSTDLTKRRLQHGERHLEAWATGWTFSLGKDWGTMFAAMHLSPEEDELDEEQRDACNTDVQPKILHEELIAVADKAQDSSDPEVSIDDPLEAGVNVRTPVCALCTWSSGPAVRLAPEEHLQVLSI
uniref:Uncharacterized protein n=1 Tax=Alexandrium monilatum TaxID=311494 RepID=A0A7S4UXH9_9DINO|mmetsp:Transcript_102015/g.304377  ORF Transcript_102015/g.304377 Transcript_102015/m.304377 type:complete len:356 (-) Transcript_102015:90-1157(-)